MFYLAYGESLLDGFWGYFFTAMGMNCGSCVLVWCLHTSRVWTNTNFKFRLNWNILNEKYLDLRITMDTLNKFDKLGGKSHSRSLWGKQYESSFVRFTWKTNRKEGIAATAWTVSWFNDTRWNKKPTDCLSLLSCEKGRDDAEKYLEFA